MARNSKSTTAPSLSDLTIDQILSVMRPKGQVLAVGKYQAIPATFKAWIASEKIPSNATFNAELQEKLGDYLVGKKRPKVAQFVNGSNNVSIEEAQLELAKEFASIPVPTRIYRKPGTAGKQDPGGWVEAGQSYYYGVAGNRATASSEKYQNALRQARSQNNFAPLKEFIARGEGNYDSLNRGVAGDTGVYSPQYYQALSAAGNAPISPPIQVTQQTTQPTSQPTTNYIEKVYTAPFKNAPNDVKNVVLFANPQTEAKRYFNDYIGKIRPLDIPDIESDMLLINSLTSQQTKRQDEVKTVLDGKLTSFSPDAKYALISEGLFELYPDTMRNKISENSVKAGSNPNYSHAWRAPGKVSITADLTIPGISGLRIGQIFWVDKISDAYKEYGAFQLLGLTETIDMSRGWTTSIHSRFNVLPRKGNERYLTDTVNNGNTSQNPTEAKPQT